MNEATKVFRSQRVVFEDGIRAAAIHTEGGIITEISSFSEVPEGAKLVEAEDCVILPGLVDCHVHVNEPGRTEWEGFETATRAAAAGGITTLVDMPLNSIPPTTTLEGFEKKKDAARGRCTIDVGFWGGLVPQNTGEVRELFDAGVLGFKCFLIDSGVEEFPPVGEKDLRRSLGALAEAGAVLLVHAELEGPIALAAKVLSKKGLARTSYRYHLESRPKASENEAIALMLRLCREFRGRIHIVHHSSSEALPLLEEARQEALPVSVETCPHYLSFAAEEIPDGATWFKCTPPIREEENRALLWKALAGGVIDAVVSDHSPCAPALKQIDSGDFVDAWGGISSLELTLSATWTEAFRRGYTLVDVARWMAQATAEIAGLNKRKGRIAKGQDADFVLFSPDRRFVVKGEALQHRHPLTPYQGRALLGVVNETYLRAECVYRRDSAGALLAPREAMGQLLIR